MGKREDHHLPIIQSHIAGNLRRPLSRVDERSGEGPTPDLVTSDGLAPSIAIEVKELVPGEFLATDAQVSGDPGLNSETLAKRWGVVVAEDPLSTRLAPMPSFPEDPSPAEVDALSRDGYSVITKAEREKRWKEEHTLAARPQVGVKNLAKDIEPHLVVLEGIGITQTRSYALPKTSGTDFRAAQTSIWAIKRRTNDAICMAHEPVGDETPGIDLHFGFGGVRTGNPDVMAGGVQTWLDSGMSENLIVSLTRSGADERHAALWLSTEAESQSAHDQGTGFCPTLPMRLPARVDVLWIFLDSLALRYDGSWCNSLVSAATT